MNKKEKTRIVNNHLNNFWFFAASFFAGIVGNFWGNLGYDSVKAWIFKDGVGSLNYLVFEILLVIVTVGALLVFGFMLKKRVDEEILDIDSAS